MTSRSNRAVETFAYAPSATRSRLLNALKVSSGNLLEMYDFMVFGYYAAAIGRAFFPAHSAFASLMLSLMTFGAGYLMRPLGALVLGSYADRRGRRKGLIVTLTLMSVGTLTLALTPGFAVIGYLAPVLVLAGRLVQGFSAGVELGSVSVYLSEIATPGRKGFYVSWQSASQQIAVIVAAALGVALNSALGAPDHERLGMANPSPDRLRHHSGPVPSAPVSARDGGVRRAEGDPRRPPSPYASAVAANWKVVLVGMMMVAMTTVSFYLITAYTPTFGREVLKLRAGPGAGRGALRRRFEPCLAAGFRRVVRQDRAQADPTGGGRRGDPDRLSGHGVVDGEPVVRSPA